MIFAKSINDVLTILVRLVQLGPPIILVGIGYFFLRRKKKSQKQANLRKEILDDDLWSPNKDKNIKVAKVFFILAVAYVVIGIGICGGV